MQRLKIFHKMILGFAFYLGIALLFGIYVHGEIGEIVALQKLVEVMADTKEELLELRRNEKNYIIRRDPVYLKKIHEIISLLEKFITNYRADIKKIFGEQAIIELTVAVDQYSLLIEDFSNNSVHIKQASEELQQVGSKLEQIRLEVNDFQLIREILETRLVEKNYILFTDDDYFRVLKIKVLNLKEALNFYPPWSALCDRYLDIASQLYTHNEIETEVLTRIREQARVMEGIINNLEVAERKNITGYVVRSQNLLWTALVCLLLFGSLLSWVLSKAIVAPLQKLEATARLITEGDYTLRLELQGDRETISLQKSINTMLDSLDLSRESLYKSVQLLQEKSIQLIESEKLASIGLLASGVAHEINNPLSNISLTAETIVESLDDVSREEMMELLNDILTETDRASHVVDNLLGYARSMKDTRTVPENVLDILRQSVKLVSHEMRLHDIELKWDLPAEPLIITGNRGKLEQVFVNIMLNAIQAMERLGTLSIKAEVDETGANALIHLQDTGPGIPPEHLKDIFYPFYTTKSTGEGTGLGLYVSHGIILEHGGVITVDSSAQNGTVFHISLPLAR